MYNYYNIVNFIIIFLIFNMITSFTIKNYNIMKFTHLKKIIFKPFQKIIYLKSNKQINIYKNPLDNNNLIIKFNENDSENDSENNDVNVIINNNSKLDYNILFNNDNELFLLLKKNILDKNIITLSPGGIYGYYDTGTCTTIKKYFNTSNNTLYSGASSGSWNSIFMSYKYNIDDLIKNIFTIPITKKTSFKNIQSMLKNKLCEKYNSNDFNLDDIYISVTVFENFSFTRYIYTDFRSLEDALDCCIASSNIPFITGNLILTYEKKLSFDGGFFKDPYLLIKNPILQINLGMWGINRSIISLFIKKDIQELYNDGINDSTQNIDKLYNIFSDKNDH